MIKQVINKSDADVCDSLLTKLILDEKQYDNAVEEIVVKDYFSVMIEKEGNILLGYYDDEVIVGYIFINKQGDNKYLLDGLYVLEDYRNKGIANNLINEAINRCREMGAKYIDINVMYKNEVAKHIYKKLGFNEFKLNLRKEL